MSQRKVILISMITKYVYTYQSDKTLYPAAPRVKWAELAWRYWPCFLTLSSFNWSLNLTCEYATFSHVLYIHVYKVIRIIQVCASITDYMQANTIIIIISYSQRFDIHHISYWSHSVFWMYFKNGTNRIPLPKINLHKT